MQPVNAETFARQDNNDRLLFEEPVDLVRLFLGETIGGIHGWTPATPGPPPLYADRNASTFIPRAPVRPYLPSGYGGSTAIDEQPKQQPRQQPRRQTRQGETVQIVLNGLLRNGDIIRYGSEDFRLSWLIPQVAGVDAPILTIFFDTTTGLISYKDDNGVIFPFGSGGGSGAITEIDGGGA